jgi:hypothetical protein
VDGHAALGEALDRVQQIGRAAGEPVGAGDDERVAFAKVAKRRFALGTPSLSVS